MHREARIPNLYTDLFHRHAANPILTAQDWPYPAHTVFNAGACQMGDVVSGVVVADVLQCSGNGFDEVSLADRGHGGVPENGESKQAV